MALIPFGGAVIPVDARAAVANAAAQRIFDVAAEYVPRAGRFLLDRYFRAPPDNVNNFLQTEYAQQLLRLKREADNLRGMGLNATNPTLYSSSPWFGSSRSGGVYYRRRRSRTYRRRNRRYVRRRYRRNYRRF